MLVTLKGLFTPQAVAEALTRLPDLKSTILDAAFPQRPTHPFPTVGLSELTPVTGTIPTVSRSGLPISIGGDELDIAFIAPQPVKPSIDVTAAELNDLKMILGNAAGLEAWKANKVEALRRTVRDTTEAMASVVLSQGKLSWPSRRSGGSLATYEVDYGPVLSYTPAAKLTAASKVRDVFLILLDMQSRIREQGIGGNVSYFAGKDVFLMLMGICENYTSTARGDSVRVEMSREQGGINIGGFDIKLMDETYKDPASGSYVPKLNPKTMLAFAADAVGKVWYCAIDSVSAQNAAVAFHVVPEALPGDSGFRLIAQSKPLPARNSKATCTAVVVD